MKEIDGNIVISRVLCGGVADCSGMLHQGDILHGINGRELTGLSVDDVADLMVTIIINFYGLVGREYFTEKTFKEC